MCLGSTFFPSPSDPHLWRLIYMIGKLLYEWRHGGRRTRLNLLEMSAFVAAFKPNRRSKRGSI